MNWSPLSPEVHVEVYSIVLIDAATEDDLSPKVRFVVRNANASKMLADDERNLLEPSKMLADDERKL